MFLVTVYFFTVLQHFSRLKMKDKNEYVVLYLWSNMFQQFLSEWLRYFQNHMVEKI